MSVPVKLWWDNRAHLTVKMLASLISEFDQMKRDHNLAAVGMTQPSYTAGSDVIDRKVKEFEAEMDYRIGILKDLQDSRAEQK